MANIRDILAKNMKENRRKYGFSQEKLAEKAGLSPQYIAMIELARKFPTPEVLDRIAGALNIETYQLFAVPPSPEETINQLRQDIRNDIRQVFGELVEKAIAEKNKN